MKKIEVSEFWAWLKNHPKGGDLYKSMKDRDKAAMEQRIKEINYQTRKIEKTLRKIHNLLKDPPGQIIEAYLIDRAKNGDKRGDE